jgi:hypothetical protein
MVRAQFFWYSSGLQDRIRSRDMFDSISEFFSSGEASGALENFNNERLMEYITSPTGVGIFIAALILMIMMKQRLVFLLLVIVMSGILIAKYTLTETGAPNSTIFIFLGATVALSAYVIYTGFIKDE